MADFATVAQLEGRWRPLSTGEQARALILLGDASAQLRVECPDIDTRITVQDGEALPELDPVVPERVVCDMVKRAMLAAVDQPAMANFQETAGPFSQSGTFLNPTGDLYLTKNERRLLGIGRQTAFTVAMVDPVEETVPWWTL